MKYFIIRPHVHPQFRKNLAANFALNVGIVWTNSPCMQDVGAWWTKSGEHQLRASSLFQSVCRFRFVIQLGICLGDIVLSNHGGKHVTILSKSKIISATHVFGAGLFLFGTSSRQGDEGCSHRGQLEHQYFWLLMMHDILRFWIMICTSYNRYSWERNSDTIPFPSWVKPSASWGWQIVSIWYILC